jgi:hypothetical protein
MITLDNLKDYSKEELIKIINILLNDHNESQKVFDKLNKKLSEIQIN